MQTCQVHDNTVTHRTHVLAALLLERPVRFAGGPFGGAGDVSLAAALAAAASLRFRFFSSSLKIFAFSAAASICASIYIVQHP